MSADFQIAAAWRVRVNVDGRDLGVFDTMSFPDHSAEVTKHRPGGQRYQVTVAGLPNTGDVTVSRGWDRNRDPQLLGFLSHRRGWGVAEITAQPLDRRFDPVGDPVIYTGKLSGFNPSDYDSDSSDVQTLELTFVVDDRVTA